MRLECRMLWYYFMVKDLESAVSFLYIIANLSSLRKINTFESEFYSLFRCLNKS